MIYFVLNNIFKVLIKMDNFIDVFFKVEIVI